MWKHHPKHIQFKLVVDDFRVKYDEKQDAQYLIEVLREHYKEVSVDWEGELFCGIKLNWDYKHRTVDLSMTGYIAKILQQFIHPTEKIPAHQHHQHVHPQYGTKVQLTEPEDKTPLLQPKDITKLQKS